MQQNTSFNVYNASAGSGKTFTLVKEYLKLLLASKKPKLFRNILAITFTNKAVGEMKLRILDTLQQFSNPEIIEFPNSMFKAIEEELSISPEKLHQKAKTILESILHNYAAFDISTIDSFTHKVIRTFAFDLKLAANFEVELDTDSLLSEAVDSVIAKAGTNKQLTKALVDFAIEKADEDKSWDVSFDLKKTAKLLVNENDNSFLEHFKGKSFQDFKLLKEHLQQKIKSCETDILHSANKALQLIEESGLLFEDFSRSYLPKHFQKLTQKNYSATFDKAWQANLGTQPLYPKRVSAEIGSIVDAIAPDLIRYFNITKTLIFQFKFLRNFYINITPISILNAINEELNFIKKDNNLVLISEFNKLIYQQIKDQPTPFIYERLGEKFKYYFIDEFQDTSELQWQNLIPLIDNALSSETGSATIVGDAKQAIYRWRGGKPELFIDLFNDKNPFYVKKDVKNLPANYRSCKAIVDFNNNFFKYLSNSFFSDKTHQNLFRASSQETFIEEEGSVSLKFLEITPGEDKNTLYTDAVLSTINDVLSCGFQYKDICVLVRKKLEGVTIANGLTEQGIPIISSETLLINNSESVKFITSFLRLVIKPEDYQLKATVIYAIAEKLQILDKHQFIKHHLKSDLHLLSKTLKSHAIDFNFNYLYENSLYNASEYIINRFQLVSSSDAYVQSFLDVVLEFSQKKASNISDFIDYWAEKESQLSITTPEEKDAVKIMTIHKSKGLEFPVVIFPYADLNIYKEKEPKIWLPINKEAYNGFSHTLLNYNKDLKQIGEETANIYNNRQSQLELDNINLLYVALTRPIEQLYVISKKEKTPSTEEKISTYSQLFIEYLNSIGLWNENESQYRFGSLKKINTHVKSPSKSISLNKFISNIDSDIFNIVTKSGLLWETDQEKAIEKGNVIHYIMSKIHSKKDIDFALDDALVEGTITENNYVSIKKDILKIIEHPKLSFYFSEDVTVYNEKDIITKQGNIVRPDRFVIDQTNLATIIDYKTGHYDKSHLLQLNTYQEVLEDIPIKVKNKILIYINDDIEIKEF